MQLVAGRKVQWFSARVKAELKALLLWLNGLRLDEGERVLVAAIVSATVREVSYCRNDQWKLHRISLTARRRFSPSTWHVFARRLTSAIQELKIAPALPGSVNVIRGSSLELQRLLRRHDHHEKFDAVLTSPPYGDSRSTVQYGAMSGISLAVLRYLRHLDVEMMLGGEIDRNCLGGSIPRPSDVQSGLVEPRYWAGAQSNDARNRVAHFLHDLEVSCAQVSPVLRTGGTAVFVTSRRRVGGWRLHLDKFVVDAFESRKFSLQSATTRRIIMKVTPSTIDRSGRSSVGSHTGHAVRTMREEQVLVFKKD